MSLPGQAVSTPPSDLRPTGQKMLAQPSMILFSSSHSSSALRLPVRFEFVHLNTETIADSGIVADIIALGAAMAIGTCGGPPIPLRGGRVDATEAGPLGVCEPETDLKTILASFSGAGFNQADAIALTACGHTMGGYGHCKAPITHHIGLY